jgi:predicted nucleic acid-binding protein
LTVVRTCCRVDPLTESRHREAVLLARRYGFHIYDATIWPAALSAGRSTLYSEDMQHGQTIDGVTLVDPFR